MKSFLVLTASLLSISVSAKEPIRIEVGTDYKKYSNEDLRRRVWQLEKAVSQLQDQVFQLAMKNNGSGSTIAPTQQWTCQIQSFGKTHVASGNTKASALAQVLKKCSDASNAIHCSESSASCDNE